MNFQWSKVNLGTCYYPEHWPEELWQSDLQRMKAVGIGTIRIGEFAWNLVEPEDGVFDFSFFDRFLELTEAEGMKVIFGTPTATPPAWLTTAHPEVLNCDRDGNPYYHGARRHYNYNSPVYQEYCSRIVEQLGQHYGQQPSIIGWQIDNELNCECDDFYSDSDHEAFREFLRETYQTLDRLNQVWGTRFWNQTYTDWEQVHAPRHTIHDTTNPHQQLDYIRFVSDSVLRFCEMQASILRKYIKPGDFVTTNGMFEHMDNHRMVENSLDVYTYDSYPNFAYMLDAKNVSPLKDRGYSQALAQVRSICPHFGIMEQQSGANGWTTRMEAPAPTPGQMSLWAMQSVANGADYISFFRWRTCTMGTEIYWHGILDYDNQDNRKLAEVGEFHKRVEKLADMTGASYKAGYAVLRDYTNHWDAQTDVWHKRLEQCSEEGLFVAGQRAHAPMDYLYFPEPDWRYEYAASERRRDAFLERMLMYPVLFLPHEVILTQENADLLESYVREGGTLILGCRTGYKNETGKCVMEELPGKLRELAGVKVVESTFVTPGEEVCVREINGRQFPASVYNDILEADEDTIVLGTYEGVVGGCYYEGATAMTEHRCGQGKVYYVGCTFSEQAAAELLSVLDLTEPWAEDIEMPAACELAVRESEEKRWFVVLNYEATPQRIVLKKEMTDVDTNLAVTGETCLKPYETKVYVTKR